MSNEKVWALSLMVVLVVFMFCAKSCFVTDTTETTKRQIGHKCECIKVIR
jgi:hypothetical protein